ncbi:MAG: hypothetical protein EB078_12625, partial [Proteobacteria bacterium]|nr:hypothetical protein [Pseudomonadota bacterium]NDD05741.1 hypothetical protein [Pseudomonadota bacterium]
EKTNQENEKENLELKKTVAKSEAAQEALKRSKEEAVDVYKIKNLELEAKLEAFRTEKSDLTKRLISFEETKEQRQKEFEEKIQRLNLAFDQREKEREGEIKSKELSELKRLQALKETWARHEKNIEEKMQLICQRHGIEYSPKEKFPFKGKPDNAVKICDEFIVFDSKSPQGESLDNFPSYIKGQAEASKKYAAYEGVKKDVFLVVPTNAIHVIGEKYMVYGDYRVHVITEDALEPILIGLKKIEDYEFAEKLSPEDREKIVTTIGKMAHGMKRRIQIDYFFANEFISVLTDAENLPTEILDEARKVERTSKLNPPQERRAKIIDSKELTKEADKLVGKATGQEINLNSNLSTLNTIPLYEDD